MIWLWIVATSWAQSDPLVRPSPPIPAPGECSESIPLRSGEPVPLALAADGIIVCSAVAEPTSSLAHLISIETYSTAADDLHQIEVNRLHAEIDELRTPDPWIERPSTQRWLGRMETALIVGIIAGGYVAIQRESR